MTAPLNIRSAFAAPIVTLQLPECEDLNADLKRLFLSKEASGDRYRKKDKTPTTQVNIFESEFDLFGWSDPPIAYLRGFCLDAVRRTVLELNAYSSQQVAQLPQLKLQVDSWFHITRYGGYIGNHTHPMAAWSGVYCVTPGESLPQHPQSGLLRFLDTRPHAAMYLDPGNVRMRSPFGIGSIDIQLKPGQLVLFPSYLAHEVLPYFGQGERITVAYNCAFQQAGVTSFGF